MQTAQDIIQRMHQEIGVSDSTIAEVLEVSREHINRIRHGHETGSEQLTRELAFVLTRMHETGFAPERKHYERKQQRPTTRKRVSSLFQRSAQPAHTQELPTHTPYAHHTLEDW